MESYDVVVVEDDDDLRNVLVATIAREGLRVTGFGAPPDALAAVKRGKPSAVVLDLLLDGNASATTELVGHLRAQDPGHEPAIILVSGMANAARHARLLGASACLRKPFSARELIEALRPWCRRLAVGSTPPVSVLV
jgi:DNA-binding response OmpR family regulator